MREGSTILLLLAGRKEGSTSATISLQRHAQGSNAEWKIGVVTNPARSILRGGASGSSRRHVVVAAPSGCDDRLLRIFVEPLLVLWRPLDRNDDSGPLKRRAFCPLVVLFTSSLLCLGIVAAWWSRASSSRLLVVGPRWARVDYRILLQR